MPELPEVETVVRDLRPHLEGRRLTAVRSGQHTLRHGWSPDWEARLAGRRIDAVRRRGKWILFDLDAEALLLHLGMTGQLTVGESARPLETHTHVFFDLDDGRQLRFRDIRRFGSATLFDGPAALEAFLTKRLGPEPFDLKPDPWRTAITATDRNLKAVLLDQSVVAGVGNIYADESLFEAKLPPSQTGRATTPREAERLRKAIVKVLNRAVEQRGSSIRNYIGGSGLKGGYQDEFRVYGRTGQPCQRCGAPIERLRLAGRSTHYCPNCQRRMPG